MVRECDSANCKCFRENSLIFASFKTQNEFEIFIHSFLFLYFVNFLRFMHQLNIISNQSYCLFKFRHVNGLLIDPDVTIYYQLCSV